MQEIPKLKPHDQLNALIIEPNKLTCNVIRGALDFHGVINTRYTESAFYALKYCEETTFDLVFISFDVQCDKDGFNLFEEMKFKKHITSSTTVVFLSAETSADLVNCVIELQPSDFWVKPLITVRAEERLGYLLEVKARLHGAKYLYDSEQYSAAIYYLERQLSEPNLKPFYPHIHRLIGQSLSHLYQFSEAELYYGKLAETYTYGWVQIALAKTMYDQDKTQQAEALTQSLIDRDDTRFSAYDLLAERAIGAGDYAKAYELIQTAADLAPRNIERNRKTWNLARLNHDKVGQLTATKNMAKFAKNSIHDSPEMTLNVIRSILDLASTVSGEEASKLLFEAKKLLKNMNNSPDIKYELSEQVSVLQARVMSASDNKEGAQEIIEPMSTDVSQKSIEDGLDLVKALHELGFWDDSLRIMDQVKDKMTSHASNGDVIAQYLEQEYDARKEIHFTHKELCDMATSCFSTKRYVSAFNYLDKAFKLTPNNVSVALSILKVLVKLDESDNVESQHTKPLDACLMLLEEKLQHQPQREKFNAYIRKIQQPKSHILQQYYADRR